LKPPPPIRLLRNSMTDAFDSDNKPPKPEEVFAPGRLPLGPKHVYVTRGEPQTRFNTAIRTSMIPLLYGEYGVGKTTLARASLRVLERTGVLVNIESSAAQTFDDVLTRCLERIEYMAVGRRTTTEIIGAAQETSSSAAASAMNWLSATLASNRSTTKSTNRTQEATAVTIRPTDSRIIELCESNSVVLLIDELHRASDTFLGDLANFIKRYKNADCQRFKIALLGTAPDAGRLVRSDPGIDRLLQEIYLPGLEDGEATEVVTRGMKQLSIQINDKAVQRIVEVCAGSPSVLQQICFELADSVFLMPVRAVNEMSVESALLSFASKKHARLNTIYLSAIERVGRSRYRTAIIYAVASTQVHYVTMETIRSHVSIYFGRDVSAKTLAGPLRQLKDEKFGRVLMDAQRLDNSGRLRDLTCFRDPALKAFVRLQMLKERARTLLDANSEA
jgi:energy-coupling factor transporter ATP-binding protein EcfA2